MKPSAMKSLLLVALLPALAFGQGFKNYQEGRKAVDQACKEKDFAKAIALAKPVKELTDKEWQRDQLDALILQSCERAKDDKALLAYGTPFVLSCTNFTTTGWPRRRAFGQVARAAIATGDLDLFKKLLDLLAKETVTEQNFECWQTAARVLVDDALAQKKKPAAEKEAIVAGFREGSTTFGLWQAPLVIGGRLAIDRLRLDESENILLKVMPQEKLTPELLHRRDLALFDGQQRVGDEKGKQQAFGRIHAFLFAYQPTNAPGTNMLAKAIGTAFTFHEKRGEWTKAAALARDLAAKRAPVLQGTVDTMLGRELAYRQLAGEDGAYRALLETFSKRPMTDEVFDGYIAGADIMFRDFYEGCESVSVFLEPIYKTRAKLRPDQRFRLLEKLFRCAERTRDIKRLKSVFAEMKALRKERDEAIEADNAAWKKALAEKKPYKRKGLRPFRISPWTFRSYAMTVFGEHDNEEAIEAFEAVIREQPKNIDHRIRLATALLFADRKKECAESLREVVTNTSCRASERFSALVLQAAAEARDEKDFTARVKKAFFGKDDVENFNLLRGASLSLFEAGVTPEKIGYILALQEIGEEMKHPEVFATYEIGYLPKAPHTAGAALASGLFEKLPKGNLFFPYSTYSSINKEKELALLKSRPAPELTKYEKGKEGFLVMAYDEVGVHLYLKLDDPEAGKTVAGLNSGASFEISIMPGDMTEYHQVFGNAAEARDVTEIEWDSPQPGRKLTRDVVQSDSAVTDDCYVFHTVMPWTACYTRMPEAGGIWRYVIACSWAGQFRTVGGGSVHEFGRGLTVRFKKAPAATPAIRKGIVEAAVGEYRKVRDEWSNASFWSDPHMGDQPFYEEVVKPLLADLDAQAKLVADGKADQKEIDRLYKDYLSRWIDFRLHLDGLRVGHLKKRFFAR